VPALRSLALLVGLSTLDVKAKPGSGSDETWSRKIDWNRIADAD